MVTLRHLFQELMEITLHLTNGKTALLNSISWNLPLTVPKKTQSLTNGIDKHSLLMEVTNTNKKQNLYVRNYAVIEKKTIIIFFLINFITIWG